MNTSGDLGNAVANPTPSGSSHSGGSARAVDLTGRERQLRAAMEAMSQVATRFCRATRRALPFMARQKGTLMPQPVSIHGPTEEPDDDAGPSFDVLLEADEMPAWGLLTLNAPALRLVLEGSLGARAASAADVGSALTLAQRALIARVARSIAQHFADAVRAEVGLSLSVVSAQARSAGSTSEHAAADGLRVDCKFEPMPGNAMVSLAMSAEALEAAARDLEEEPPNAGDPRMAEALQDVAVEVVAELGRLQLGLKHVLGLQVGQVLRLRTAVDDPILVRVAGTAKFTAKPVVSRGQVSVSIRGRCAE